MPIIGLGCPECEGACSGGIGAITDRTDNEMWLCNWTPLRWTEYCRVPTEEEIAKDTSYYGPNLSEENRQLAEKLALENIKKSNLCELKDGFFDRATCEFEMGEFTAKTQTVLIAIAAGIGLLALIRR